MRPVLCIVVVLSAALTLAQVPAVPPQLGNVARPIWVAHAAYHVHSNRDYAAPLILETLLTTARELEAAGSPFDLQELGNQALQLHANFEKAYPRSTRRQLSSVRARLLLDTYWESWVGDLGAFFIDKLRFPAPRAILLPKADIDATRDSNLLVLMSQGITDEVNGSFESAFDIKDALLRAQTDRLLSASLGVSLNDTVDAIKLKSPTLYQHLEAHKLLGDPKRLSAGDLKSATDRELNDINLTLRDSSKRTLTTQGIQVTGAPVEVLSPDELQKLRVRQQDQVEAGRASLYVINKFIEPIDPSFARAASGIAEASFEAWEAFLKYNDKVVDGTATTYSAVALMGNWIQFAFAIMEILMPSPEPTDFVLEELNNIRELILEVYQALDMRFDRLEQIVEANQRQNLDAFRLLLTQGDITQQRLDQARLALATVTDKIDEIGAMVHNAARTQHNLAFLKSQRECSVIETTNANLRARPATCVKTFLDLALDVSRNFPFTEKSRSRAGTAQQLAVSPYAAANFLRVKASQLGAGGNEGGDIGNGLIWSNAVLALYSAAFNRPEIRNLLDSNTRKRLHDEGRRSQRAVRLIFYENVTVNQGSKFESKELSPKADFFDVLAEAYKDKVIALGESVVRVGAEYAKLSLQSVNPYLSRLESFSKLSPTDDKTFSVSLPSRVPRCEAETDQNLPADIPLPEMLHTRLQPEMRVAAKIDPSGHPVRFCYQVFMSNLRTAAIQPTTPNRLVSILYYFAPVLRIMAMQADVAPPMAFSLVLPDMRLVILHTRAENHRDFKEVGTFNDDNVPAEIRAMEGPAWPMRFSKWIADGGLREFTKQSKTVYVRESDELVASKGMMMQYPELEKFIFNRLDEHRLKANGKFLQEIALAGDVRRSISELAELKQLIHSFIRLKAPFHVATDYGVQAIALRDLVTFDPTIDWQVPTYLFDDPRTMKAPAWYQEPAKPVTRSPAPPVLLDVNTLTPERKVMLAIEELAEIGVRRSLRDTSIERRLAELSSSFNVQEGYEPLFDIPLALLMETEVAVNVPSPSKPVR
jgi:hypothetical protein